MAKASVRQSLIESLSVPSATSCELCTPLCRFRMSARPSSAGRNAENALRDEFESIRTRVDALTLTRDRLSHARPRLISIERII